MSRKIHKSPVALTTDGSLVANVAGFGPTNVEGLIARALDDDAELFSASCSTTPSARSCSSDSTTPPPTPSRRFT